MLKVWGRSNSINVQKVMWLIGELEMEYERIPAGGKYGMVDRPEFLVMNPHGQVPVIADGGMVIWESHAILRYLAAVYGATRFWSQDPGARSMMDRWMDWAQSSLQPAFQTGVFRGWYRTPADQRDMSRVEQSVAQCARYFELLDEVLAGQPFLSGENLGLADIPAGAMLYRYFELDIKRPRVPRVEAWYARLCERQAYRDHVMVPFEELRGRLDFQAS
jgi:glutathione S-transferase